MSKSKKKNTSNQSDTKGCQNQSDRHTDSVKSENSTRTENKNDKSCQ